MSRQIIKKGISASTAVLISRVLGLLRDMLLARVIGGGAIMSAWILAFKIPNTFRRFFGEGAASQALIPMLGHIIEKEGIHKARNDFGIILGTLGVVLAVISILIGICGIAISPYFDVERVHFALILLPILMPYTFFICLTGVCAGILNLFGRFFLPALNSVILNLAIIVTLLVFWGGNPKILIYRVSWAVLFSGVIQLAAMMFLLKKANMLPTSYMPKLWNNYAVNEFITLAVPGLIGAAALQINTLVDSFIAIYIGNYAAPALYYSERLIYLPIGIFAVSIGNAALVTMSKHAAEKRYDKLQQALRYGLKQMFFISVPIALFLLIFRYPIISLIYGGDRFGEKELSETAWAMLFYSMGIPAFAALKIILSGFYSRKDMKTPVKIALACVFTNFVLNIILMWPLQQGGIALATTISSIINCSVLFFILNKKLGIVFDRKFDVLVSFFKILCVSLVAVGIGKIFYFYIKQTAILHHFDWHGIVSLFLSGVVFVVIFFCLNLIIKSDEQKEWLAVYLNHFLK
jgi:putative peptidoglycan lipid II flippase